MEDGKENGKEKRGTDRKQKLRENINREYRGIYVFLTSDGDSQAKATLFREIWRVTLSNWYQAWQECVRRQDGGQYLRLSFVVRLYILNRYIKLL